MFFVSQICKLYIFFLIRKGKRNRESSVPPNGPVSPMVDPPSVVPKTHSVAMTTARDAIVAFGAGHGGLSVPVERRITRYLRQEASIETRIKWYAVVTRSMSGRRMGGGGPDLGEEVPFWPLTYTP